MCWQLICVFFSFEWMLTCRLIVKMSFEIAIPSHNNPCMIHVWIKQIILIVFDIRLATWTPKSSTWSHGIPIITLIETWKAPWFSNIFWKCSYRLNVCNIQQVSYFEENKTIWSDYIVGQYSHLQDKYLVNQTSHWCLF